VARAEDVVRVTRDAMNIRVLIAVAIVFLVGNYWGNRTVNAQGFTPEICQEWVQTEPSLRIATLRLAMRRTLNERVNERMLDCFCEYENLKLLDDALVEECKEGTADVQAAFNSHMEATGFKCLKWFNDVD